MHTHKHICKLNVVTLNGHFELLNFRLGITTNFYMLFLVRPRLLNKYHTTKTKVTTLANHNVNQQYGEPIKTQHSHVKLE